MTNRPEKHKLGRGLWVLSFYRGASKYLKSVRILRELASCQVSPKSVQRFAEENLEICILVSEARAAIFVDRSTEKNPIKLVELIHWIYTYLPTFESTVFVGGGGGGVMTPTLNCCAGHSARRPFTHTFVHFLTISKHIYVWFTKY